MALIYRPVVEIEDSDSRFVDRARAPILDWLRLKADRAGVDPEIVELIALGEVVTVPWQSSRGSAGESTGKASSRRVVPSAEAR